MNLLNESNYNLVNKNAKLINSEDATIEEMPADLCINIR